MTDEPLRTYIIKFVNGEKLEVEQKGQTQATFTRNGLPREIGDWSFNPDKILWCKKE